MPERIDARAVRPRPARPARLLRGRQIVGQAAALPGGDGREFGIAAADQPHLGAPGRARRDGSCRSGRSPTSAPPRPGRRSSNSVTPRPTPTTSPANSWPSTVPRADAEGYRIFGDMQVGPADAASGDPQQYFVVGRLGRFAHRRRAAAGRPSRRWRLSSAILEKRSPCREPGRVDHLADQAPDAAAGEERHERGSAGPARRGRSRRIRRTSGRRRSRCSAPISTPSRDPNPPDHDDEDRDVGPVRVVGRGRRDAQAAP